MLRNYACGARIENRRLVLNSERAFKTAMWRMKEGPKIVRVEEPRSKRTIDQNAYLHAVPFPILADYFGNTIPETKYVLMGECWGWKVCPIAKREIPIKPSTSEMTVEECTYFIDWLIPWAAQNHNVLIPLPSEYLP